MAKKMMIRIRLLLLFFVALMLLILPGPMSLQSIMPDWCLLLLFASYRVRPDILNVGFAWMLGFLLDGLTGSLLGLHGLGFCLTLYVFSLLDLRTRLCHMPQQILVIACLAALNMIILWCAQALFSVSEVSMYRFYSIPFTALCWPIVLFSASYCLKAPTHKDWGTW
jgi:rod shape-determining protein MreD